MLAVCEGCPIHRCFGGGDANRIYEGRRMHQRHAFHGIDYVENDRFGHICRGMQTNDADAKGRLAHLCFAARGIYNVHDGCLGYPCCGFGGFASHSEGRLLNHAVQLIYLFKAILTTV